QEGRGENAIQQPLSIQYNPARSTLTCWASGAGGNAGNAGNGHYIPAASNLHGWAYTLRRFLRHIHLNDKEQVMYRAMLLGAILSGLSVSPAALAAPHV